jgi:hypothetical protein
MTCESAAMTAKTPRPENLKSGKPASTSLKPMLYVVPVFVVMASLTMHASNGFLHAIFGGGPNTVLRPLDTFNGLAMGIIGPAPLTFVFGTLTGMLCGLTYWMGARKHKSLMEKAASEPDKRRAVKRRAPKPREPEQAIVDPNRVAKVMGLRASAGGDVRSFEA